MLKRVMTIGLALLLSGTALADGESQLVGLYLENREPEVDDKTTMNAVGEAKSEQPFVVGIDDTLVAYLRDARLLANRAKCLDQDGRKIDGACEEQNLALYLDGNKLAESKPERVEGASAGNVSGLGKVRFKLEYDQDVNKDAWARLLGSPRLREFFQKPVTVRVGLVDGYIVPVAREGALDKDLDHKVRLQRIKEGWFIASSLVLALLMWIFIRKIRTTDLLRDRGESEDPASKPWSLARCQMAFWFFLITGSFLFIWLITNALDTITTSTLVLMGMGAGTALGSALIDASRDTLAQRSELIDAAKQLEAQIADAGQLQKQDSVAALGWNGVVASTQKRLADIQKQLAALDAPAKSDSFWNDILRDGSAMSFHRFQMVVWTAVLGVVFIYNVWKTLAMPEFDTTLLSLMGISSGTYLGFKLPSANG
ncbi:hypothetical protein [Methylogaea oryzae]|nr:hypothetical protein [Methylogaea oryzae]